MLRRPLIAGIAGATLVVALAAAPASADHITLVQVLLPENRIVTVTTAAPGKATSDVRVTGLEADETLVGIDRRPLNGVVYGVAQSGDGTNLYAIDANGVATGRLALFDIAMPTTPIVLEGSSFGVDFNPAADALRIVSDTGQNLRAFPPGRATGTAGATTRDGNLNTADSTRTPTGVVAAAYKNNVAMAPSTELLDIDADDDVLWTQAPPNSGGLTNARRLGIPTSSVAALDIQTVGGVDTAYAILGQETGQSGVSRLVVLDTATGAVTELGALGKYRNAIGMAL
jgi:hypothetical protein